MIEGRETEEVEDSEETDEHSAGLRPAYDAVSFCLYSIMLMQ